MTTENQNKIADFIPSETPLILIVDDQPKNLQILGSLLREKKYKVSFATDGEQALNNAENNIPDLILLDIRMPGMDGYEVCRILKSKENLKDVPVIFLTSETKTDDIVKGFEIGAVDYVGKPFNEKELIARVETQLNLKRSRDAIVQYNIKLNELNTELENDLIEAEAYVVSLLPQPIDGVIKIDWKFYPSKHLGGDGFGYHKIDKDNVAVYLLDVSGHGVGSSLLCTTILDILNAESLPTVEFKNPVSVLNELNKRFQMNNHEEKYFTIWYGVIDLKSRKLKYSVAGHPPAVLYKSSENNFVFLDQKSVWIGLDRSQKYTSDEFQLSAGDKIFVYSDGVYEFFKSDGEIMDHGTFMTILKEEVKANESALSNIHDKLVSLLKGENFEDDYSMMEILIK